MRFLSLALLGRGGLFYFRIMEYFGFILFDKDAKWADLKRLTLVTTFRS